MGTFQFNSNKILAHTRFEQCGIKSTIYVRCSERRFKNCEGLTEHMDEAMAWSNPKSSCQEKLCELSIEMWRTYVNNQNIGKFCYNKNIIFLKNYISEICKKKNNYIVNNRESGSINNKKNPKL